MLAVAELASHVGLSSACQAFSLNRGSRGGPERQRLHGPVFRPSGLGLDGQGGGTP